MAVSFSMQDIYAAQKTIKGVASRTPLLYSPSISRDIGSRVYLKLENFQPIRVFKIRGATNTIKNCPPGKTIVTASSGNHGYAVAYVCSLLGRSAIVYVPETANPDKKNAIKECGAELREIGRSYDEAYEEAVRFCKRTDMIFVHPYADPMVMAGQGTVGLEIIEDNPQVGTVVVPIGGGGLIGGTAFALKNLKKSVRVIGVQSENAPSMSEAFRLGRPVKVELTPTIADGMVVSLTTDTMLQVVRQCVNEIVLVSDSDLEKAMLTLLKKDHVLAEPSGAASVAAILKGAAGKSREIVAVVSGGNISINYLSKLLQKDLEQT
ncbi:MAG TPA: threonine/serine dehydratase [Candidatus Bathyarchaeia archaeon]|nr:threonine/serine dehydratase [Candidatus Bathyarchaeia archaeon]